MITKIKVNGFHFLKLLITKDTASWIKDSTYLTSLIWWSTEYKFEQKCEFHISILADLSARLDHFKKKDLKPKWANKENRTVSYSIIENINIIQLVEKKLKSENKGKLWKKLIKIWMSKNNK